MIAARNAHFTCRRPGVRRRIIEFSRGMRDRAVPSPGNKNLAAWQQRGSVFAARIIRLSDRPERLLRICQTGTQYYYSYSYPRGMFRFHKPASLKKYFADSIRKAGRDSGRMRRWQELPDIAPAHPPLNAILQKTCCLPPERL
jgi:hypothetical protein